ncbi:MAG: hypothetical protein ABWY93_06945 [Mycobacterium sp.]
MDSRHSRLAAAVIGSGAIALMGVLGVAHNGLQPGSSKFMSDSGDESKFPTFSSPVVPAMKTDAAGMSMGATTTAVVPQTVMATEKAVPAITPAP